VIGGLSEVCTLFARLCEIPSPSGGEQAMADAVIRELERMGASITQDDAATMVAPAGCNNIVARFAPTAPGTPIMFCAHVDTVPLLAPVEVVQDGEWLTNANEGILGGDDKAAVAVMLHAVDRIVREGIPHAGIELVFTPCEEIGLQGAAYFDPSVLQAEFGFVYDHTGELGGIVTSAPTHKEIDATFRGVAAHAGIQPEQGRNAIFAAARARSTWAEAAAWVASAARTRASACARLRASRKSAPPPSITASTVLPASTAAPAFQSMRRNCPPTGADTI
jgi:tripeptide aminopeptidase